MSALPAADLPHTRTHVPNPDDGRPQHPDPGQVLLLAQADGKPWCMWPGQWTAAQSPTGCFPLPLNQMMRRKDAKCLNIFFNLISILNFRCVNNLTVGDLFIKEYAQSWLPSTSTFKQISSDVSRIIKCRWSLRPVAGPVPEDKEGGREEWLHYHPMIVFNHSMIIYVLLDIIRHLTFEI